MLKYTANQHYKTSIRGSIYYVFLQRRNFVKKIMCNLTSWFLNHGTSLHFKKDFLSKYTLFKKWLTYLLIISRSGISMSRSSISRNDGGGGVVHLTVSGSVGSISWVVVGVDSIGLTSISVVSSVPGMSGCSVCSQVVVSISVVYSIVSGSSTVVSGDSVVSGFLVVGVGLFVSGSL